MNIWKRITSCVLCAGLLLTPMNGVPEKPAASIMVRAADSAATVSVGQCGDNLIYKITSDGVLHITGSGSMEDFYSMNSVPWKNERQTITGLEIEDRVTSIGKLRSVL